MIVHVLSQRGPDLALLTARNIMTRDMPTATPDDSIHDIACRMRYSRSRHIPVLEKGKLAELISAGDIVKLRAENTEQEAQELHEYIIGSGHTAIQFPAGTPPIQYGEKKS
ncbi:signal-transduction protein [Komagataeibacter europaeus NBRC 3261]|uniref:Signal-transduction protein n=2 Tax=Komagataeibacter europaeus TaxID=33995 RepID=A0A0D6Q4X6_KOMEU|nr:signal-transduction protein [Komagataeibacter europaeus NBRC 3261]